LITWFSALILLIILLDSEIYYIEWKQNKETNNKEIWVNKMNNYQFTNFTELKDNFYIEKVRKNTNEWIKKFNLLLKNEKILVNAEKSLFSDLISLTYNYASKEHFQLISDYAFWLFLTDDVFIFSDWLFSI
jgi:hypothetical protein